jgi:hypothetical protein
MLCGADVTDRNRAVAFGNVPGEALPRDPASTFFLEDVPADQGRRSRVNAARAVHVGRDGHWVACGLPIDVPQVLWLRHDGRRMEVLRFRIPKGVDLAAVASPSSLPWSVAEPSRLELPARGGALRLYVLSSSTASALTDAEVRIDDTLRVRFVADTGAYSLAGLSSGVHRMSVRRMGFSPLVKAVMLSEGATVIDTVTLARNATQLAEVVINGRRVSYSSRFVGVVERARVHSGALFTREDMQSVRDVKSLLARLPGVQANDRGVTFARCEAALPSVGHASAAPSNVQVYIDGVRATAIADGTGVQAALRLVPPASVEFIEVYVGVARIPAEWQNDACAVIAIWTKRW